MSARGKAKWILVTGIAVLGLYWYPRSWPGSDFINGLYDALSASLLAISVTVLLIDGSNEQRDKRQLKKRLIWEMGSADQAFAIRAVKELRDADWLTDGSLRCADLTLANLQRAQLSNAYLQGVILAGSNLKWAILEEADLQNANLEGVNAENLVARRAKVQGAALRRARLSEAVLEEIDGGDKTDMLGASLIRANLRGAKLSGAQLEECDFIRADLTGSDLSGSNLLRADIAEAVLDNVNLERADLSELEGWESVRSIERARISGVRNAPNGFRQWAVAHGALDATSDRETTGHSSPQVRNDAASLMPASAYSPSDADADELTEPSNRQGTDATGAPATRLQYSEGPGIESHSVAPSVSVTSNDELLLQLQRERVNAALNWQVGDRIIHEKFGSGTIISKAGPVDNPDVTVDFGEENGKMSFSVRHAAMWKVASGE